MGNNTTASYNTAVGYQAGYSNTTGGITALGMQAGYTNSTGVANIAIGGQTLYTNSTSSYNLAIGGGALYNNTGASNIGLGHQALASQTTASNNTAVGYQAHYTPTTGGLNTAFGNQSGYSLTSGAHNVLIGPLAGYNLTTGYNNTFIGTDNGSEYTCGGRITTGYKNTIIGGYSGNQGGLDIRTASNYVVLSDGDGNPLAFTANSNTFALQGGTISSGTGIAFPATQSASTDANTLDDYEEGTWTPTIIGSSTNPTVSYNSRTGTYTKIGRMCYFQCSVSMSSYSGGSGRVIVTGLPFTAAANGTGNGAPSNTLVSYMTMTAGYTQITNYVDPNTTNFNWLETGTGVVYHDMTVGQFQTATTFIVSGFYIVA